jgi:hypothetical protein
MVRGHNIFIGIDLEHDAMSTQNLFPSSPGPHLGHCSSFPSFSWEHAHPTTWHYYSLKVSGYLFPFTSLFFYHLHFTERLLSVVFSFEWEGKAI